MKKSIISQMKRAGISAFAGMIVSAVLTILPAILISKEVIGMDKGGGAMFFVVLLGAFAASLMACGGAKEGRGRAALLSAGIMYALLICLGAVICFEELLGVKLVTNALAVFGGSLLGCAICLNRNKRAKGRKRKYYAK